VPLILTTTEPCQAHVSHHAPIPLLNEKHHVLPQSWQETWAPNGNTHRLCAPGTVTLCPTAHRNVHVWLPRMMRVVETIVATTHADPDDVADVHAATRAKWAVKRPTTEFFLAERALVLWCDAGGRLADLVTAGQWGYGVAAPS
jgi:hypothetical protein